MGANGRGVGGRALPAAGPPRSRRDVLDGLARPDGIDARVVERQRLAVQPLTQVKPRNALARAAQRLERDVDGDRLGARVQQLRAELAGAAPDVEHGLAGAHVRQQEVAPQLEALGARAGGHVLPDGVVECPLLDHMAGRSNIG